MEELSTSKLSQFVDDTVIFVVSLVSVQYLFDIVLPICERALGMKLNAAKTEGLLL